MKTHLSDHSGYPTDICGTRKRRRRIYEDSRSIAEPLAQRLQLVPGNPRNRYVT